MDGMSMKVENPTPEFQKGERKKYLSKAINSISKSQSFLVFTVNEDGTGEITSLIQGDENKDKINILMTKFIEKHILKDLT